jgi:hypothetical protein
MNPAEKPAPFIPSASEYILDNFEPTDRIAMLALNRDFGETLQRTTSAWLGHSSPHTTSSISVHTAWPVLVVGSTARRIALPHSSLRARKICFAFSKTSP